ncbi:YraN family protein [bacterium]|nr:YraN family protein [candidate division CSSED10-310 bacterium]
MDTKKYNKVKGDRGEEFARVYLVELGWTIVKAPFKCRTGEIDIIAMDGKTLVFVEVKSRKTDDFGNPIMAVNYYKQRKIIKTARFFLSFSNPPAFQYCRFDVLGLIPQTHSGNYQIHHIRDAFRLEPEDMAFSY